MANDLQELRTIPETLAVTRITNHKAQGIILDIGDDTYSLFGKSDLAGHMICIDRAGMGVVTGVTSERTEWSVMQGISEHDISAIAVAMLTDVKGGSGMNAPSQGQILQAMLQSPGGNLMKVMLRVREFITFNTRPMVSFN